MATLVTSEFFDQGDQERELFGTEPMPMMDRNKQGDLPKMQIGFIDGVCKMAYEVKKVYTLFVSMTIKFSIKILEKKKCL